MSEHLKSAKNLKVEETVVVEHFFNTGQVIQFIQANVLARIGNYEERLSREAIQIVKESENFNK